MTEPVCAERIDRSRRGGPEATRLIGEWFEPAGRFEVSFALNDYAMWRVDEADVCRSVIARLFVGLWARSFEIRVPALFHAIMKALMRRKFIDQFRYSRADRRDIHRSVERLAPAVPIERAAPDRTPRSIVGGTNLCGTLICGLTPGSATRAASPPRKAGSGTRSGWRG